MSMHLIYYAFKKTFNLKSTSTNYLVPNFLTENVEYIHFIVLTKTLNVI